MKIAIIGAGNVGATLGQAWAARGHDIVFGVRHPGDEKIKTLVQPTGGKVGDQQAGTLTPTGQVVPVRSPSSIVDR